MPDDKSLKCYIEMLLTVEFSCLTSFLVLVSTADWTTCNLLGCCQIICCRSKVNKNSLYSNKQDDASEYSVIAQSSIKVQWFSICIMECKALNQQFLFHNNLICQGKKYYMQSENTQTRFVILPTKQVSLKSTGNCFYWRRGSMLSIWMKYLNIFI